MKKALLSTVLLSFLLSSCASMFEVSDRPEDDIYAPITRYPVVYAELPRAQHAFEIFHSPRTSHYLNAAAIWLEWVRAKHERGV